MRPTKKIAAEFVAVFLMGAAAGGLLTWDLTDKQISNFMSHTTDPDDLVAHISKKYAADYHLTPEEQARIQPDIKEMAQEIYRVRHQFGVDIIATLDKYHAQIAQKLDPDHRAAYELSAADRRKKLSALLLPDQSSPAQGGK